MTEQALNQYLGKNIEVICTDGRKISGLCSTVTSALDNEPDPASLCVEGPQIGLVEILLPDIRSVTIE